MPSLAFLDGRGVLAIAGDDRVTFLQGLTSNDVTQVGPGRAVWSALLTPQGKYLHDFLIATLDDALLLDCEADRRDDLLRRLKLYKLRAMVALSDATERHAVAAVFGDGAAQVFGLPEQPGAALPFGGGIACVDPRLAALGVRLILPRETAAAVLADTGLTPATAEDYDRWRLAQGVPDGSRDLEIDKSTLLEGNFDELHGISWTKGCYIGQELTARTKYRGLLKRRLVPVTVDGPLPPPGTPVLMGGREVGELRSGADGHAIALLRLDAVSTADTGQTVLIAGEARVTPRRPEWLEPTAKSASS